MSRHGVPPLGRGGGYSMPRHRGPGGILCLGMVYPGVPGVRGAAYTGPFSRDEE